MTTRYVFISTVASSINFDVPRINQAHAEYRKHANVQNTALRNVNCCNAAALQCSVLRNAVLKILQQDGRHAAAHQCVKVLQVPYMP
jgi:hypothetical protein